MAVEMAGKNLKKKLREGKHYKKTTRKAKGK